MATLAAHFALFDASTKKMLNAQVKYNCHVKHKKQESPFWTALTSSQRSKILFEDLASLLIVKYV